MIFISKNVKEKFKIQLNITSEAMLNLMKVYPSSSKSVFFLSLSLRPAALFSINKFNKELALQSEIGKILKIKNLKI